MLGCFTAASGPFCAPPATPLSVRRAVESRKADLLGARPPSQLALPTPSVSGQELSISTGIKSFDTRLPSTTTKVIFITMVKFNFSSVFLILASVFALVSAVPNVASPFRISSVRTGMFISSNGTEQAGDSVTTIPFTLGDMLLAIDPSPRDAPVTFSTVRGKSGLYIASVNGPELIWNTTPYTWKFILQQPGTYLVTYVDGRDAYWAGVPYQTNIIAVSGHDVNQNEICFNPLFLHPPFAQVYWNAGVGSERDGELDRRNLHKIACRLKLNSVRTWLHLKVVRHVFTFAFAFLILTNLFAFVSAIHPVPSFRITSLETSRVIFSDGNEQEGHRVITIPAHHENVRNSLVTIDPPIALGSPVGSLSTVKGKAGLYVSVKIDKTGGGYLIWSTVQYQWWFLLQPAETYYTVAVPDQDYYWYGESSTDGLDVKFEAGAMQTRQVFFKVTTGPTYSHASDMNVKAVHVDLGLEKIREKGLSLRKETNETTDPDFIIEDHHLICNRT
ncbi:hypothetical protein F5887DRAFT_1244641 [Amanita rubescens]|nr:hypothetical protein F5887DRAFT_1244641 [Amanita rubescens]